MRTIVPIDTELVSTPAPAHHHIALFRAGDSIYAVTEEGDFVATPVAPMPTLHASDVPQISRRSC